MIETAKEFFDACEDGKGWEGCKAYCHDGATFSCQADALAGVDALVLPTTPTTAPLLPGEGASIEESMAAAFGPLANTIPFNNTHHPAISVPCGMLDGLPVGMMLVGRFFDEATLYRLAHAFEREGDWRQR